MVGSNIIAKRAPNCSREVRVVCRSTVRRYRRMARSGGEMRKRSNGYESTVTDVVGHCRRGILCRQLSVVAFFRCTITHGPVARMRVDLGGLEIVRDGLNECFRVTSKFVRFGTDTRDIHPWTSKILLVHAYTTVLTWQAMHVPSRRTLLGPRNSRIPEMRELIYIYMQIHVNLV